MKWESFWAVLQAIFFILTSVYKIDAEKREDAKQLSLEADAAIRDRRYDDVIAIWSRMRNI